MKLQSVIDELFSFVDSSQGEMGTSKV